MLMGVPKIPTCFASDHMQPRFCLFVEKFA